MNNIKLVSTLDLVECLSFAMDLTSPLIANHQRRVGYIAYQLGREIGLPDEEQNDLLIAGLLHDCGALSMLKRELTLRFDFDDVTLSTFDHAEAGYQLIKKFQPFAQVARYIRYHHLPWARGAGTSKAADAVPIHSHIIHLADRVDVLIGKGEHILLQSGQILKKISRKSDSLFAAHLVEALQSLAGKESFWLDIETLNSGVVFSGYTNFSHLKLDAANFMNMVALFGYIIDFRSRFTATHSSGVAATGEALGRLAGFSADDCFFLKMAGYLHDLGKLVVPNEILEKPGKLTPEEFAVIRSHTYYTYKILKKFRDLDEVSQWAAYHHERIDGKGYPFHLAGEELCLGARIMAVVDVFTAIAEDRPYRAGMNKERAVVILREMAVNHALDAELVDLLVHNLDEVNEIRIAAQARAQKDYQDFERSLLK